MSKRASAPIALRDTQTALLFSDIELREKDSVIIYVKRAKRVKQVGRNISASSFPPKVVSLTRYRYSTPAVPAL